MVVEYGSVGRTLTRSFGDLRNNPVVIALNVDTVRTLHAEGARAIYGDASREEVLRAAETGEAGYLLVTLPEQSVRGPIIALARAMSPDLKVLVRAHFIAERTALVRSGATAVAYEEAEVAVALAEMLLQEIGVNEEDLQARASAIRSELAIVRTRAELEGLVTLRVAHSAQCGPLPGVSESGARVGPPLRRAHRFAPPWFSLPVTQARGRRC